ncbi:unnamed protein product [Rhizoctonia solani]|uniref:Peptidase M43 pregnancy-associated plasma-A domain-containing protein n=1 Tax=Rhizoctonia solani TaxID=456999 RepID=A0A8H3GIM6_9AGAM|nr:unnamed protein product [Rhizoctonia solani]
MFVSFIALAFGITSVAGLAKNQTRKACSFDLSAADVETAETHFEANKISLMSTESTKSGASVPVHWHVIQADNSLRRGNVPDSQIHASIKVLNEDYAPTGLSFTLASTTRTTNMAWFNRAVVKSTYQTSMKQKLRRGNAAALNVYTVGFSDVPYDYQTLTGYSSLPYFYSRNPTDDGVVILYSTLPGGSAAPFNLGRVLTHEVGHWAGLFHTFQGGCNGRGDYIRDTPPEGEPTFGCPAKKDTCRGGGSDPIHNYMDFSDDACMNEVRTIVIVHGLN